MNKVAIIGMDGTTWHLLDPWIESGELKNFLRLKKEGAYGDLKSVLPPSTCPAWECMVTGKHPGALGLFSAHERKSGTYEIQISPFRWHEWDPIWEVLARYKKRPYVLNVPMVVVPQNASQLGGVFITGPLLPETVLAYPPELDARLRRMGYQVNKPDIRQIGPESFLRWVNEATEIKFRVAAKLYEDGQWDFFMFVFFYVDPVMHYFWKYMDPKSPYFVPNSPYADAILSHYKRLDKYLGFFMDRLPEDAYLFLVSDHGHSVLYKEVNLNAWLKEHGYLSLEGNSDIMSCGRIDLGWVEKVDMDWRRMPDGTSYIGVFFRGNRRPPVSDRMYQDLFRSLSHRLLELYRQDGIPVEEVRTRGDLYPSIPIQFLPDLVIKVASGFSKEGLQQLGQGIVSVVRSVSYRGSGLRIDWKNTRAYTYLEKGIFINLKGREPLGIVEAGREYEDLVEEIRAMLYEWIDPDCGGHVVQEVLRPNEAYGYHPEGFPDLIIRFTDGGKYRAVTLIDMVYEDFAWRGPFRDPLMFSSSHTDWGIIAAYGPDVSPGKEVIGASIPDVMPTVLHLMDVPIPDSVTGKPLLSLFAPDSDTARKPIVTEQGVDRCFSANSGWSKDEEEAIEAHLRALGYID
mgnify:CR=1 FL=1